MTQISKLSSEQLEARVVVDLSKAVLEFGTTLRRIQSGEQDTEQLTRDFLHKIGIKRKHDFNNRADFTEKFLRGRKTSFDKDEKLDFVYTLIDYYKRHHIENRNCFIESLEKGEYNAEFDEIFPTKSSGRKAVVQRSVVEDAEARRSTATRSLQKPKSSTGKVGKPALAKTITNEQKDQIIKFVDSIIRLGKINYSQAQIKIAEILERPSLGLETVKKLLVDIGYNIKKGQSVPLNSKPVAQSSNVTSTPAKSLLQPSPVRKKKVVQRPTYPVTPKIKEKRALRALPKAELLGVLLDYDNGSLDFESAFEMIRSVEDLHLNDASTVVLKSIKVDPMADLIYDLMQPGFRQSNSKYSNTAFDTAKKTQIMVAALKLYDKDTGFGAMLRDERNLSFFHFVSNLAGLK